MFYLPKNELNQQVLYFPIYYKKNLNPSNKHISDICTNDLQNKNILIWKQSRFRCIKNINAG